MNTYKALTPLVLSVPAEMLESWAGFTEDDARKEILFALAAADIDHAETLQWLAAGIERHLKQLSA